MTVKRACCPESAARMIKKLDIGGTPIAIVQLNGIIKEVSELGIKDMTRIEEELLKRVKIINYVPHSAEKDYSKALLNEYMKKRTG